MTITRSQLIDTSVGQHEGIRMQLPRTSDRLSLLEFAAALQSGTSRNVGGCTEGEGAGLYASGRLPLHGWPVYANS